MLDLIPGTLILRLFLTPEHFLGVRVLGKCRFVTFTRERIELFDAHQRDIVELVLLPPLHQIEVDLARAEHDRSEEHTSELQSLMRISYAVFCLKKKTNTNNITRDTQQ